MAVNNATGYNRTTNEPLDALYLNSGSVYASTTEVNSKVNIIVRYTGSMFNVNGELYWYKNGVQDSDLVLFNDFATGSLEGTASWASNSISASRAELATSASNAATASSADQFEIRTVPNATTDTDKFIVLDGSAVKYRTGAEVLSDINAQPSGSYITSLTGEVTAAGPGAASATLLNSAVIGKVLTGLNVTGGTIVATDTILQAFGKAQNQITGLMGGATYQNVWNASTNSPTITSSVGTKGHYYVVNVAGSTNIDGITDWKVGDWIIFNGATWDKVDNTDAVSSVNGYVGSVSLVTGDILEGAGTIPGRPSQLFFTAARAQAAISSSATGLTYNSTTGVFTITSGYVIPTTTQETNWNLAYTQTRQWDGGATGLVAATGRTSLGLGTMALEATSSYYTQTQINNFFSGASAMTGYNRANWDTAFGWGNHATAGYFLASNFNSSFDTRLGTKTTDNLAEGTTNLYYTNARARASLSAAGTGLTYNSSTGVFTWTNPGYITGYTETDPIYTASSWYSTTNNSSNWNTAYGWGNHAGLYVGLTNTQTVGGLKTFSSQSTFLNAMSVVANSGAIGLTMRGRASDNYFIAEYRDNTGTTRYGYIQGHSTYGGTIAIVGDGGTRIDLDNRGLTVNNVLNGTTGIFSGNLTAASFIRSGGTSSQFLKADGSVDASTYITAAHQYYIGTTHNALNRASGAQTLTGVSIDGNAATATNVAASGITGGAALSLTDDTNVTISQTGSTTALLAAKGLVMGWTGTLADSRITSAATWHAKQAAYTNLTSIGALANANGFLRQNGAGVFSYDTNTYYLASNPNGYITGNQTITLSGHVTGSGATSISTTIANGVVTTAMMASANISQWTNDSGYITGYTEIDTLASVTNRGNTTSQDIVFSNGRKGLVGVYDAAQTQAIFAMGAAYTLTDGGASNVIGNLYGLAWSYNPDYGGVGNNPQSKAGLNHQLLLMQAGVTTIALGSGLWTSGAITTTSTISASNFSGTHSGSSSGTNTGDQDLSGLALRGLSNVNGVLSSTYGGAGIINGILKANGSGVVSAATASDIPSLSAYYLPLSGGTLTGALSGTSLSMSGGVSTNTLIAPSGAMTLTGTLAAGRGRFKQNSVIPTGAISDYTLGASDGLYGLYMGVATSGVSWMQSGREDNSTTYALTINPQGGNVLIGTTTDAGYKLNVKGSLNIGQDEYLRGGGYKMAYRSSIINFQYSGTTGWQVNNDADNIALLSILNSGAATFSSSISGTSLSMSGNGAFGSNLSVTNSTHPTITINAPTDNFAQLLYNENGSLKWNAYNDYTTDRYTLGTSGGAKFQFTPDARLLINTTTDNGTDALQVAGSGLFTGGTVVSNGAFYKATRNSGALVTEMIGIPSGSDNVRILTTGDLNVVNGSLVNLLTIANSGAITASSSVTASSLIKSGGTSAQFLKADGSLDGNTYATTSALSGYVALTGNQTVAGIKTFTSNLEVSSTIRSTAAAAPLVGSGLEFLYNGAAGIIQTYNRSGSAYLPLVLEGLTTTINSATGGTVTLGGSLSGTSLSMSGGVNLATTSGNVGIGTSSPGVNLEIASTTSTARMRLNSSGSGQNASIELYQAGSAKWEIGTGMATTSDFEIRDRVNATNRLTITSGGNVLIKTTTDNGTDALQVAGSGLFSGALKVNNTITAEQSSTSSAIVATSGWGGGTDNTIITFGRLALAVAGAVGYDDPNTGLYIGTTTNHKFSIRTNNFDRLTFANSGAATFSSSVSGTSLSMSGDITANSRVILTTSVAPTAQGQLGYSSAAGSYWWGKAGSINDFTLYNSGGTPTIQIPTGTTNVTLSGALSGTSLSMSGGGGFGGLVTLGSGYYVNAGSENRYYNAAGSNWAVIQGGSFTGSGLGEIKVTAGSGNGILVANSGNTLIKTTTDNGTDALQVAGSGLFSGSVSANSIKVNGASATSELNIYATSNPTITFQDEAANRGQISANSASLILNSLTSNSIKLQVDGSDKLSIASTGAATFSSSVTASGKYTTNSSSGYTLLSGANELFSLGYSGGTLLNRFTGTSFFIAENGTPQLSIAAGGAATFSSSVEALRYQATSSSASLVAYGVGTGLGMYNVGTNILGFATASTNRLTIDASGAATFSSSVTATQFKTGGTPSNTAGFTNSIYLESAIPSITLSNTSASNGKFTLGATSGLFGIWNNATSLYEVVIDPVGSGLFEVRRAASFTSSVTATNFIGAGTGLTGYASSFGSAYSYRVAPLGDYSLMHSSLPNDFSLGIQNSFVGPAEGWPSYGSILLMKAYSGGGGSALQMYIPYSPTYGGTRVGVRFGNYDAGGNAWTGWKYLLSDATDPYAYNMNQYVRTTDNVTFNQVTASSSVTASSLIKSGGTSTQALIADGSVLGISNSAGANTLVQRDASGYIFNNYFYTSSGGAERNTSGLGYFAGFNSSDYYIRSYTPTAARLAMGLGTGDNVVFNQVTATLIGISSGVVVNYNNDSASTYQMLWGSGNYVYGTAGIYCNPSTDTIYANGNIIAYASSDSRYKDNQQLITNPIGKLLALRGMTFTWNNLQQDFKGNDYGLIYQDVAAVMPEITQMRENGYGAIKYEKVIPLLVEVGKNHEQRIQELENKLQAYENKFGKLN